ncbi:ribose-phosphate pyrophosphokinase 1 [Philodulcilactobacillus myokoensis]|uniref:Ribose-phosphate pyrophosphokinase n=1 Tax=Philodulcilactobacillus myokoensis TaxID=2929573 RepID=A0A9W6ESN2_9LACO|nr:ribose-phosphate diphosphokinase [Philodulcilactobacillus myokoensis]GLB47226.1 ribose-phosphate pyrophosphokinase 1 [Philodulcilactobacillus myokoensis]
MANNNIDPKLKLFSLDSNRPLAESMANEMGIKLSQAKIGHFSDGEINVNIEESVRGDNVYIVQSTSNPVNDNLMELLIMIDALKRASAQTINVVIPYYGYARQDRKTHAREPITSKLVADMLQTAGIDRVVTLDLHAAQIQGFFNVPVDHLMGAPLFAGYFHDEGFGSDSVVVSPDHGGVVRARAVADSLKAPIAIIDKRRPKANVAKVMNIIGDVKGKSCLMVDDIVDTAGTLTLGAKALMDAGAKEVYACATHPVLSGPAIDRIKNSPIKKLVVTDSIQLPAEKKIDNISQISVAPLLANAITRIDKNEPVSPLFKQRFIDSKEI